MEEIVAIILAAVDGGSQITIYGDYDADGVCATSILVELLRSLGAKCDWLIPDRISEGYGLSLDLVEALAARGTDLVVTVDCGVTSVEEAASAKNLGMGIVITDHHQFGEEIPDCPVLHPVLSGYPYEHLCGAGVASKLASAIRASTGLDPAGDEADLDLVALATVADMMPLTGENRRLVREGTAVARRGGRVGMRALMAAAGVEPAALTAEDFGFRLGPRVNAVGRMYRADAGVELFLTGDPVRAGEIGEELSRANTERRAVEREVEVEAERAFKETHGEDASAIVVAREGWHQGVVGIVAARLARRHGLPALVISTNGETGKGSARSVPGLDLHAALTDVGSLLTAFGGHKAAAGITIPVERIDRLRAELDRAVAIRTGGGPVISIPAVDSFVGGADIDLDGAESLARLEPFGKGNRAPCLVIPSARVEDLREMGQGKHCRFSIVSGGHRASGLAFGRKSFPGPDGVPLDLVGELTVNHWRGTSEPRFQVTTAAPRPEDPSGPLEAAGDDEWWERFEAAMAGETLARSGPVGERVPEAIRWPGSAEAAMAQVISSGATVLIVTAEACRRWTMLGGGAIGRFAPESSEVASSGVAGLWPGSSLELLRNPDEILDARIGLTDFETLEIAEGLVEGFDETVIFDPPASEAQLLWAGSGSNRLHRVEDPSSVGFALAAAAERSDPVPQLRTLYREVAEGGRLTGSALLECLRGTGEHPRSPERAASLVRVVIEAGVVASEGNRSDRGLEVVSSKDVDLNRSAEFRHLASIHKEQIAFIRQSESRKR